MKKIIKISIIILIVIAVLIRLWFVGYHSRKSQDNLPSLERIATMSEAELNDLLIGYRNHQLEDVWGKPDEKVDSGQTWIWKLDENRILLVSANNENKIVVCGVEER